MVVCICVWLCLYVCPWTYVYSVYLDAFVYIVYVYIYFICVVDVCVDVCVNRCGGQCLILSVCSIISYLLRQCLLLNLVLTDCIYCHPAFSRDLFVSDLHSQRKDCGHLVPIYMCLTSEFRVSFLHSTGDILPTESSPMFWLIPVRLIQPDCLHDLDFKI